MASKITGFTSEAARQKAISSGRISSSKASKLPIEPSGGRSDEPNIILSATPNIGGVKQPTSTTYYRGSTPVSAEQYGINTNQVMTPQSLQSSSVANIPSFINASGTAGGIGSATGLATSAFDGNTGQTFYDSYGNAVTQPMAEQDTSDTSSLESLFSKYMPKRESVLQNRDYIQAQNQYDQARQRASNLNAQITNITQKANADAISFTGLGRGIPEAIIGGQQAQVYKEAAIQALPLQAQLAFAQGDVTTAQEHLTRVSAILTEEANNNYESQKMLFSSVVGYATDVQKMRMQAALDTNKSFAAQQSAVYQMLSQNAAPPTVWEAVRGARNAQQLYQAAGQYGTDMLEAEYRRAQINATDRSNRTTVPSAPVITQEQANDPFVKKLIASSGGKPVTGTPLDRIEKARTVLGQLGSLQASIQETNTGPIVGAFKGANPWDTNAQVIKGKLNAIIPNLARGIYGEVGVLTDNDIKNYKGTLGNLTSTEDVNNALLYITIDLVGRSIRNTLEVQAAGGRDVSGFADIYTDMEATKSSLLSQFPQNVEITKDDEALFTDTVGLAVSGGGFWSSLWKGLTGN